MKFNLLKTTFVVMLINIGASSYAAETNYSKLPDSDKGLIDTAQTQWRPGSTGESCLRDNCNQDMYDGWINGMLRESEGKKFFAPMMNEPPHIRNPKILSEFKTRYKNLASLEKQGNICYLVKEWWLTFDNSGYSIMTADLGVSGGFKYTTRAYKLENGKFVKLLNNGKFLDLIPTNLFTQSIYAKFQKYSNSQDWNTRPALKVCGSFKNEHSEILSNAENPDGKYNQTEPVYIFEVSKPIEVVQPTTLKTLDTIPSEWYGYSRAK